MRILMLAPGNSIHSIRPLNWLLDAGHQVLFIDGENPYPQGRENYYFIPYLNSNHSFVVPMLKAIAKDFKPHITHVHWLDWRAYQCMAAELKPLILTTWGSDINNYFMPAKPFLLDVHLLAETLRYADTIFVDTPDIAEKCQQLAQQPVASRLLTLGVNTHLFKPGYSPQAQKIRETLHISPTARVLLSIRAMTPLYNHQQILSAFHQALPHFQHETILIFKKYNNRHFYHYQLELQENIQKNRLSEAVRWLDYCSFEELPALYALADAIVSYPQIDAFPVTFLEAAACQKPVISHLLPAYENTFAQQYFKLLPFADINALSQRFIDVVNAPPHAQAMMQLKALRQHIIHHYDESHTISALTVVYETFANSYQASGVQSDFISQFSPDDWRMYLEKGLARLSDDGQRPYLDMYQLASVLKRIGESDKAESLFQQVAQQSDEKKLISGAYFHLGEIALQANHTDQAQHFFQLCLRHEPDFSKASQYLLILQAQPNN